ncbi:uncharacterized protein FOKN1_2172 [Thiohalobacter thiocyanaticus]|uniref:Polysaccharide chain length determinant N-terminal domain-containing protein n=2 Tax=Thiohalobacter thiocyanaticus TaxID=585455 RepID=A0A1Z4VSE3_9GAMM|nr:uncharacterized protein FOKN1_2172 [Thiohalobacter thiocyanaticus]
MIDFFRVLARHKLIAFGVFLFVVALAIGYLSVKEPVYTVSSRLVPPDISDIKELLLAEPVLWGMKTEDGKLVGYTTGKSLLNKYGLESITPTSVFESYVKNCNSEEARSRFSGSNNPRSFKISSVNNIPAIVISLSHRDPEYAATKVNEFVKYIERYTAQKITDDIEQVIEIEVKKLSRDMDAQLSSETIDQVNINSKDILLDVELLQKRINYLNSLSVDLSNTSVVNVDSPAKPTSVPDKPNKTLILSLSIALGVLLGILSAFIKEFMSKYKKQT